MAKAENGGAGRRIPWRWIGWSIPVLLLLLPLVAMQFTDEVDWDLPDFVFMGVMFGAVGLGVELAVKRTPNVAYRIGAGLALVTGFLTVWVNAAVGMIGGGRQGQNLFFLGVLAIGLAGAVLARFRPLGTSWAMAAAALANALVPVLLVPVFASAFTPAVQASAWSPRVLVLVGVFSGLWLLSAVLFWAARKRSLAAEEG